jgi:hypothetical protein
MDDLRSAALLDLTCDTTSGLEGQRLADLLVLLAVWLDLHTNRGL